MSHISASLKSFIDSTTQEEEQVSDEFNALLRELLGRTVIPPIPFEDIDEPCVLDCGFGKGAWIDDLLGAYNSQEVLVSNNLLHPKHMSTQYRCDRGTR
jgi:hypothetical protein